MCVYRVHAKIREKNGARAVILPGNDDNGTVELDIFQKWSWKNRKRKRGVKDDHMFLLLNK